VGGSTAFIDEIAVGDGVVADDLVPGWQYEDFLLLARAPSFRYQDLDVGQRFAEAVVLSAVAEGEWSEAVGKCGRGLECDPPEWRMGEEVDFEDGCPVLLAEVDLQAETLPEGDCFGVGSRVAWQFAEFKTRNPFLF
jgi:hypothetical protein